MKKVVEELKRHALTAIFLYAAAGCCFRTSDCYR